MRVIVIYELVPEDTKIYDLELEEDSEELTKLKDAAGTYSNTVGADVELHDWVWNFLQHKPELSVTQHHNINEPCVLIHTGGLL